jgi:hypothetical protein
VWYLVNTLGILLHYGSTSTIYWEPQGCGGTQVSTRQYWVVLVPIAW